MFRSAIMTAAGAVALMGVISAPAHADLFNATFNNADFSVDLNIVATPDGGNFDVTGISGTVISGANTFSVNGLVTGGSNPPTPPNNGTTPDGLFFFNDVIFTAGGLHWDFNGLVFTAGSFEYNLYSNGADNNALSATDPLAVYARDNLGVGTITAVPEPQTWAMMILGFCGVGFMAYRRKRAGGASLRLA